MWRTRTEPHVESFCGVMNAIPMSKATSYLSWAPQHGHKTTKNGKTFARLSILTTSKTLGGGFNPIFWANSQTMFISLGFPS